MNRNDFQSCIDSHHRDDAFTVFQTNDGNLYRVATSRELVAAIRLSPNATRHSIKTHTDLVWLSIKQDGDNGTRIVDKHDIFGHLVVVHIPLKFIEQALNTTTPIAETIHTS